MKKLFFILFVLTCSCRVFAQIDTEFWFAMPKIVDTRSDKNYLSFATYDEPAEITISQPANPSFEPIKISLEAQGFQDLLIDSYREKFYTYPYNQPLDKGLLITSTAPISAYYSLRNSNSELYSLKGTNALGYEFIVPMQYDHLNGNLSNGQAYSSIEIVASEDDTNVRIKAKYPVYNKSINDTIRVTLNKGQSYSIRSNGTAAGSQLRNTYIKSDKPIAVNSTDDLLKCGTSDYDLVGDQIVPISLAGTEYIVTRNQGNSEKLYLFPVESGVTTVSIYANYMDSNPTKTIALDEGKEQMVDLLYEIGTEACYIRSDKKLVVFQLTSGGNELGGTMLPNLECTGSQTIAYNPSFGTEVQAFLVTKRENTSGFNNYILATDFMDVPGTNGEWQFTKTLLKKVNVRKPIRLTNSMGVFHLSVKDEKDGTFSYGYFSNYNSVPLGSETGVSHYIVGDEITIVVPDANDYTNITVTLPDGTVHHSTPPFEDNIVLRLPNVDKSYEGEYRIDAQGGVCDVEPDYIQVSVYELPVPQDLSMCLGDALSISSPGYGPYQWKGDGEFGNTKTIEFIPTKGDTTYQVTVTSQQPGINIVSDGDFENRETDKINSDYTYLAVGTLSPGQYAIGSNPQSYHSAYIKHGDHTSGYGNQMIVNSSGNESTIWRQTLRGLIPGNMYEFSAWFLGVNPAASPVNIKYKMDGLFVNERDDQGELITDPEGNYYEVPQYTVEQDQEWHQLKYGFKAENSIADISIVLVETPGGSAVSVDDIRLSPLYTMPDTFNIHVQDSLHPVLKGSPYICQGIATVGLEESYDSYQWSNGQTTPEATFSSTGEYSVQVTRGECQRGTLVFTINPSAKVSVTVEDIPEFCLGSDYVDFPLTVTEGSLGYYSLHFDESAQSAHFQDLEMNESGEDYIRIPIPVNALPGTYKMTLDVYEAGCQGKGDVLPGSEIEFTLKYGSDIIAQRWNDVLSVKSSDYTNGESFSGYQWYRNGEALPGETRPYYYNNSEFTAGDCYSVTLTREDGTEVSSCEYCPEHIDAVLESTVSPVSLVNSSASLSLPSEDGVEGKAYIRDMNGGLITVQSYTGDSPEITAPSQQGVYVLEMVSDKDYRKYKIVVK